MRASQVKDKSMRRPAGPQNQDRVLRQCGSCMHPCERQANNVQQLNAFSGGTR
jgi:hypothetical protein